ncbi:hypothetical protein IFM89_013415 [Coptis chinensis]|uniref:DUF1664 domain-containing protein n=1 Tax=Coptis chinensis TaxID=261450 RepID=A0A835LAV2_9MAGN|nr:hypothetical protein IFM89_013415 [Coptis chinensis]
MANAVANVSKQLEQVTTVLDSTKRHLSQRLENLVGKLDEEMETTKLIANEVIKVKSDLFQIGFDVGVIQKIVSGLEGKIELIESKQDITNSGLWYLCQFAGVIKDGVNHNHTQKALLAEPPQKRLPHSSKCSFCRTSCAISENGQFKHAPNKDMIFIQIIVREKEPRNCCQQLPGFVLVQGIVPFFRYGTYKLIYPWVSSVKTGPEKGPRVSPVDTACDKKLDLPYSLSLLPIKAIQRLLSGSMFAFRGPSAWKLGCNKILCTYEFPAPRIEQSYLIYLFAMLQDVGSTKLPPDRLMLMEDDKLKGLQFIADTTDTGDAAKRSIIQKDKSTKSNLITTSRIHRPYSVGISYAPDA